MTTTATSTKLTKGDILAGDIGYSMELPVFYEVLDITPSGKSAIIRELATTAYPDDKYGQYGMLVPVRNTFARQSQNQTKRIKSSNYCGEYVMVGYHHMLTKWNGEPLRYNYMD